jgi:hypothetical protein
MCIAKEIFCGLFVPVVYYLCWGLMGYGLLVLTEPDAPAAPPTDVVIKCKGLV